MKPKIALFLNHPKCSVQCGNGMMRSLSSHFDFKIFSKHPLESDFFDEVQMIAVPGGIGDSDSFDSLMSNHKEKITSFVENGGKYLGICMGAYWADKNYFGLLKNSRAVQYITRPNTDTHRPHAKDMSVTWEGKPMNMFFYDGCAFTGDDFTIVATYPNGDPMAIVQDNLALIGCHPEADKHWYDMYSWMKPKWHGGQHDLLREFVVNFFEK